MATSEDIELALASDRDRGILGYSGACAITASVSGPSRFILIGFHGSRGGGCALSTIDVITRMLLVVSSAVTLVVSCADDKQSAMDKAIRYAGDHGIDEPTARRLWGNIEVESLTYNDDETIEIFEPVVDACDGGPNDIISLIDSGPDLFEKHLKVACSDALDKARSSNVRGDLGTVEAAARRLADVDRGGVCNMPENVEREGPCSSGAFALIPSFESSAPNSTDFYVTEEEAVTVRDGLLDTYDLLGDFVLELSRDTLIVRAWMQQWADVVCVAASAPGATDDSVAGEMLERLTSAGLPSDYIDDLWFIALSASDVACRSTLDALGLQ